MKPAVLILPGIDNSGPGHWQTLWEECDPSFTRVSQADWNNPVCSEWAINLEDAVRQAGKQTILVAHSLASLLVVHWAAITRQHILAALLVSPPDPANPNFPRKAIGFEHVPQEHLPFRSIVVASSNDPYASLDYMRDCAAAWGSDFVNIGAYGHINAASNLGIWQQGLDLLQSLREIPLPDPASQLSG